MRHWLCGTLAAIVGLWLAVVPAIGQTTTGTPQTQPAAKKTWTSARTPDGQPDLQGIWEGGWVDGRAHVGPDMQLFMGDSVGHWEGTTLVVDTTNFTGTGWYDMVGTPQSSALHTIERFTMVDANTIDYAVTIDDPKLFTQPWTYAGSFRQAATEGMQTTELFEMACAEGSRALEHAMERPGKPLPPEKPQPR